MSEVFVVVQDRTYLKIDKVAKQLGKSIDEVINFVLLHGVLPTRQDFSKAENAGA